MSQGFASNTPAVAALDWGTTRLRAWLIDGSGKVIAERRGDDGLITAREKGFSNVLEGHLAAMGAPETLPVIICGMAGSRQGWIEAPYVTVPAPIGAILGGAARVADQKRDIRIVPGLAQRLADAPDVMRGEETQLAGAGLPAKRRHLACMPGTHSKWVVVEDGAVAGFGTWPTGELFSVLAAHSILKHSLGEHPAPVAADNPFFRQWCERALGEGGDVTSKRVCHPRRRAPARSEGAGCGGLPVRAFDRRRDCLGEAPLRRRRRAGRADRFRARWPRSIAPHSTLRGLPAAPSMRMKRCAPASSRPRAKTA